MAIKRGVAAINTVQNPNKYNTSLLSLQGQVGKLLTTGRVKSIILDDTHPLFEDFGQWNALGTIEYISSTSTTLNSKTLYAKPLDPNNKFYPLINEIVYIFELPNSNLGENYEGVSSYYINTVGLWNSQHHNAYPENPNAPQPVQNKDYLETELGSVRRATDQSTEIYLGRTFVERGDIHPLLPFEGDKILEGRWGNTLRFGSTVKNTNNSWSSVGTNGDPITILRNGQGARSDEGWVPVTEEINNDDTSIYLTSTQKIPIGVSSINDYFSYTTDKPTIPNQYTGKQLILNSGRLVFNTTEDHLLLSSKKSINLNAVESINFDTTGATILQSGEVYLGSKSATEPVLLGNATVELLFQLLENLATLTANLAAQVGVPPGAPLEPTRTAATLVNNNINNLLLNLESLKSNSVKTV